ncbi:hypothetical protein LINPERHAP2_LOCUS36213 [Linum perenne]
MIKLISWNCRGAGNDRFLSAFKSYILEFNPNVVILVEPKISGDNSVRVCRKLGFDAFLRVKVVGFSGGIWVVWHPTKFSLTFIDSSDQHIHFQGELATMGKFGLTAVYGRLSSAERESCGLSSTEFRQVK